MTTTEGPARRRQVRAERAAVDKFEQRRAELASSALTTLADRGFANTSLRDIAENSPYSHGVVHYYFSDKLELMQHCIRQYKQDCVKHYDEILDTATTPKELREGFADAMVMTLRDETTLHRMWYDLRNQSMYTCELVGVIQEIDQLLEQMVWRVVSRYSELAESPSRMSSPVAYSLYDGLFLRALIDYLAGKPESAETLRRECAGLLAMLCP
ncbi:TetR family transcriptional regulator [Mumia zhuanghuii]|uniref:TetR/AcrR family transcriptional regulator n=2 Tax=Mumia TaxID=1546255 RepID=A0ABW1QIH3_9ACTN|nr:MULTISPECIES: TetR/AcrR family transcriptional regulator [Mumia]KAA1424769.1 TetR family transcriptional regulator [Mumia zhuanghuii]